MSDEGLGQRRTVAGPIELTPGHGSVPFVLPLPYTALPHTEIEWRGGVGREPAKIWTAVLIDVEGAQGTTNARRRIGVDPGRAVSTRQAATVGGESVDLRLTPSAAEVRRGDTVAAAVLVGPDVPVGGLEVGLVGKAKMYTTTERDSSSKGWFTLVDIAEWTPLSGSSTHTFTVPADGPPSFEPNQMVQVQWALVVRKPVRLLPDKVIARAPVRVLP